MRPVLPRRTEQLPRPQPHRFYPITAPGTRLPDVTVPKIASQPLWVELTQSPGVHLDDRKNNPCIFRTGAKAAATTSPVIAPPAPPSLLIPRWLRSQKPAIAGSEQNQSCEPNRRPH